RRDRRAARGGRLRRGARGLGRLAGAAAVGGGGVTETTSPGADEAQAKAARTRPVTLADIARVAGTSASTAARALSGRGYVSPAARERLLLAAEQLGYVPNA